MIRFALLAALLLPGAALAQAYDPGPMGDVPGSSASGMRIGGSPAAPAGPRIRGADVFGDTVTERAYGKNFDDSYLKPKGPRSRAAQPSTAERAVEGRSDLNGINAGSFARQGPGAVGRSEVTRGRSAGSHRAIIRR
ncbi:hypothetical protein H9Q09_11405 [Aurantimonas sp. DM33-3]|uniref:hypothetical protein n=1 Tax=Aurantimonas sp. DM33-3 TaxID=2766955 RepID=UPI001652105C|nr:hypothetical protein [Aurantimonas sp. DM33-3]MBC6716812.1 hypothetical protein [Aurantimonas sp. DM33-3]